MTSNEHKRSSFATRLGFILVTAGCAVGLGNVWRFPFITGQSGGAVFVILYLVILLCLGLPLMTVELAIGRASRRSIARAFTKLRADKKYWNVISVMSLIGLYVLMSYYSVISGWLLHYLYQTANGSVIGISESKVSASFTELLSSPGRMTRKKKRVPAILLPGVLRILHRAAWQQMVPGTVPIRALMQVQCRVRVPGLPKRKNRKV